MKESIPQRTKRINDVGNICRHARFVICLDNKGRIINIIDRPDSDAKIIALVRTEDLFGESLAERVLLEVGFGRTRPYAAVEKDGKLLMKDRKVTEVFPLHDHPKAYRTIFECVEKVVVETCAKWEKPGDWFVEGVGFVPRGVTFTVARRDSLLARGMLLDDVRRQRERNIDKHVRAIAQWVGHYRRADFSETQLRQFEGAAKTAELLTTYEKRPRHRDALMRSIGSKTKLRAIVDRIIEVYKIDFSLVDTEAEFIISKGFTVPPVVKEVWVRERPKPSVHARDCFVFEIGVVDQGKIWKRKEEIDGEIRQGEGT